MVDKVECPLVDKNIEDIECLETRDVVCKILKDECIPEEFKQKENWQEICKRCKYHNY